MKHDSSTDCWNQITDAWIDVAQTNDFRMLYIMPFTLSRLGDVAGKTILDIGCGEGGYSRALAKKGADVSAVDCSENVIKYSKIKAADENLIISHYLRNSSDLYDIPDNFFDIVLSSMMLMDCEDFSGTMSEISRVMKPGGKLFVSVLHPCFNGRSIRSQMADGVRQVVVRDYFTPTEWEAPITSGSDVNVIWRHRTLQDYVKAFIKNGLKITDLNEPVPDDEQIAASYRISWLSKIPMFIFFELEK
jgi:2-polyprenyl-3-methyl-5-hydroxy-6-metoxy-1,4-benzoquinol methylase